MKNWEKQLKIYQLIPPPPKLPLQEYIVRYLAERDDKYLNWFLHTAEPLLNQMAQGLVVRYAMYGFFLDLKQACVEGILKALQDYDPEKNTAFWWYARQYHIPDAVHNLVRQLRPGFSVQSKDEYDTLRKIMWMYQDLRQKQEPNPIGRIAEGNGLSEKKVSEYLQAGMRNMSLVPMEMQENGDEDGEITHIPAPDYSADPARQLLRMEREEKLFEAFSALSYREQDIVASHLGFCPKCLNTKNADGSNRQREYFEDLAIFYGLTPKAAAKVYDKAIEKLRKALHPWEEFGEEDQLVSSSLL